LGQAGPSERDQVHVGLTSKIVPLGPTCPPPEGMPGGISFPIPLPRKRPSAFKLVLSARHRPAYDRRAAQSFPPPVAGLHHAEDVVKRLLVVARDDALLGLPPERKRARSRVGAQADRMDGRARLLKLRANAGKPEPASQRRSRRLRARPIHAGTADL